MKQGVARRGSSKSGSTPKSTAKSFNWFLHWELPIQWQDVEQPEPSLRQAQREVHWFVQMQEAGGGALSSSV